VKVSRSNSANPGIWPIVNPQPPESRKRPNTLVTSATTLDVIDGTTTAPHWPHGSSAAAGY
jgi:hypothetical protein